MTRFAQFEQRHRLAVEHGLPTAAVRSSQATPAAVDKPASSVGQP
jgi:hypothetical protein